MTGMSFSKYLYKGIRIFLLTLLLLIGLILALLFFFVGTDTGYRQLPKLLNHFTPYTLSYREVSGHLLGKQQWQDFSLLGPGVDIRAKNLLLIIKGNQLWHKTLTVETLQADRLQVSIPTSDSPKASAETTLSALPEIRLPVAIDIQNLSVTDSEIKQNKESLLHIDKLDAHAQYRDAALTLTGTINSDKGNADLQTSLQTLADYPISLSLTGTTPLLQPQQQLLIHWSESVLKPQITLQLQGAVTAKADISADISLQAQHIEANLAWQNVDYLKQYQSENGTLQITGAFDDLQTNLSLSFRGQEIPAGTLSLHAQIHDRQIKDAALKVQSSAGDIAFNGYLDFAGELSWDGVLKLSDIDTQKVRKDIDLRLNGLVKTHGGQENNMFNAYAGIESLQGYWQGEPLTGKGEINYRDNRLHIEQFHLNLAGNKITANGHADMQAADIKLSVIAPALNRLLPDLNGNVEGKARVSGSLIQPQLLADVTWNNLAYGDKSNVLFRSARGNLHAAGDLNALQVSLQGQVQGKDLPSVVARASAKLLPKTKAEDIRLSLKTLQGQINATGEVEYAPQLKWKMKVDTVGINPAALLPELAGEINADITSQGKIAQGKPIASATINRLSGRWQKQTLNGTGSILINGEDIEAKNLALSVGNNRLQLNGTMAKKQLALEFSLAGEKLAAFYPELAGSLNGKGKIKGSISAPQIQAQFTGKNITFGDNKVAALNVSLNSVLQGAGSFDNRIELQNIQVAEQQWQRVLVDTQGYYDKHALHLQTTGGNVNLQLNGRGGFTAIDAWQGILSALNLDAYETKWQLQNPAEVKFSPEDFFVRHFCLQDRFSGLCIDVLHSRQTVVDYEISELSPRSFAAFIPDEFAVKTALKGKGKITVQADGQLRGNADIYLTPGSISVFSDNQPPLVLKLKQAKLQAQFNDRQAKTELSVDFMESGSIKGQALLSDYRKKNIIGQFAVQIPDLGKFKKFIPKAGEVGGNINGQLQISGTVDTPKISGDIELKNGVIKIPEYATDLEHIRIRLSAHKTGQIDIDGKIGTPEGDLTTQGNLFLSPLKLNLSLNGKNMLVANAKDMKVVISPEFRIVVNPKSGININGKVLIPKASVTLPDFSAGQSISSDVVMVNEKKKDKQAISNDADSPVHANVAVVLGDAVYFRNKDANIRLKGSIDIIVRPGQPVNARGVIEVASGIYQLYGQELDIQRGRVSFAGGNINNPTVDVLALREVDNVEVGASVKGPVEHLQLKLTSTPAMPDSAILSYLIFGRPPDDSMDSEALLQMAAGLSLGSVLSNRLSEKTGLDVFDLGVSGLKAGKYLGKDLYIGLKSNFFTGVTQFIARYQFTNRLNLEATAQEQEQAVDLLYQFEKN